MIHPASQGSGNPRGYPGPYREMNLALRRRTHAQLITCLADWNKQDPMQIVPAALKEGIGLYGFSKPGPDSLLPLEAMLACPVSQLNGDAKNIAVLARAFHGVSANAMRSPDGRFVEPQKRLVK